MEPGWSGSLDDMKFAFADTNFAIRYDETGLAGRGV
jgi:hypothetical protein